MINLAQIVFVAAMNAITAAERAEIDRVESAVDAMELEQLDRQTARILRNQEMSFESGRHMWASESECSQW